MKKIMMLSSVLATALMMTVVSCSSSDDITGGNGSGNAEGTTSYIAINLNSVGNAPTSRAYVQGDGTYDDGETNENKITSVRFYFYNVDGTSYKLQTAGENGQKPSKNYIDYQVELGGGNHDNTVSGTTSAVLVLNGESNVAPAAMLTVVNPGVNTEMLDRTTADRWSTMRTEMKGQRFNDATNGFMMSNSTYEDGGKDLCTTQLTGKTFSSAADAKNSPVDVFVERVNAKVKTDVDKANFEKVTTDVMFDGVNFKGKYKTKVPVGKLTATLSDGKTKTTDVYAYIDAWGLGDEDGWAMLYKQIDVQNWTNATLGFSANNPWSVAAYHRCFWGTSVAFGGTSSNSPVNHPYKDIKAELGTALYTLPNTPTSYNEGVFTDPMKSYLTKIMVAARLAYTDEAGKVQPAEICTYKGQKFLGEGNVKTVIARELRTYYKKITSDTYKQIEASDIDFSSKVTSTSGLKLQNYQVVADLRSGLTELFLKKGGNFEPVAVATVKAEMQQAPVDISKGGRTYYYTPIKHLGDVNTPAEYGVVRNHSYQVEISSIKGFGTPVYNPDSEIITPVLPSDDLTYLAAKISVLSWRVVSKKVDLDSTK